MPDITKCEGKACPFKDTCYLYRAIPSEYRQSFFVETPFKDGLCDHYYPIEPGMRLNNTNSVDTGRKSVEKTPSQTEKEGEP
jgi:hypothetical protein